MKVNFTDTGALLIEAENHTERVALKSFLEGYDPSSKNNKNLIAFNFDSYLKKSDKQSEAV